MLNKSHVCSRRILNTPAIRPCEFVSHNTLVTSLINLAATICHYKFKSFVTNKRNARESIRLVGNLLIFLEEIRSLKLSSTVVLSLSELHFIFQKVNYLLEDCSRDDARLWVLIKSDKVAVQFRVLIRDIGVALDVLPLDSINVSTEVKQLVELVTRQALKANLEVERDDKKALDQVHLIMGLFEAETVPKSSDLRWVLDYLGIQRWCQCNREIKFLDSEMGLEHSATEKRDLGLLSSLLGFMAYSRCVLFDVVDSVSTQEYQTSSCNSEAIKFLNPEDFRCPISLEVMTDPVIIATGHTYDRSSIVKWFKAGNHTCPKTGNNLTCTDLVPNLALKQLIMQYCLENGISIAESGLRNRDMAKTVLAGSVAAEGAMKMLANFLTSKLLAIPRKEQNKAAYEIRLLTKTSIFNRSCLVEAGVVPNLLNLISFKDSAIQENAIASLLNLSKYSKTKSILVENRGLELVLGVLKNGLKMEARYHAAGTLFYLASVEEYRAIIGEIPEAFRSLMELLVEGGDRGKKNALVAIFGLIMYPENHCRVLEAGLVPLLVNLLENSERADIITDSLAVLATLAEKLDGAMAILSADALRVIMGVLSSTDSRVAKEYCLSLLLGLCVNGGADVVLFIAKNPSFMGPLYSLLTEGTPRARKKASSLIRILHEFNEKSSYGLRTPILQRERFIHVW